MSPGRAWRVPADWPGGVRHEGDASLVCCGCMERGKTRPDTAAAGGERETTEQQKLRGAEYRRGVGWRTGS